MNIKHSTGHETTKRMKNFLLWLYFFALTTQICQAQPYESIFGEESTSWNVFGANSLSSWTDSIYSQNDSVISGTTYKVIQSKGSFPDTVYFAREDTITGKLYYAKKGDTTEILVMDLSLNPGDSFFIETHSGSSMPETWRVDSVFTDTGRKHIELIHGSTPEKITFIEGIGPSAGILYPESPSFIIPELICTWKNGNQTFANPDFDNRCNAGSWSTAEDLQSHKENSITLYPNPTRNEIRIAGNESEQFKEYRILSIDGRLVKSGRLNNEKVIQAGELSPGLYVVVLLHDEGSITRKIVIE